MTIEEAYKLAIQACRETWNEKTVKQIEEALKPAQPEIVRCKYCKHREVENGFCEGRGWPMQLVPDDGFCEKGESEKV